MTRDDRIESYYQQSAWALAERIVDLEDEREDVELLLTAASEAIRQRWSGDSSKSRIGAQLGELAMELFNERRKSNGSES